jgi:hypothetical protein
MKFAFVDQPYLGCCRLYGHYHNDGGGRPFDGICWDDIRAHDEILRWVASNYDGFAMCMGTDDIVDIAPLLKALRPHWGAWTKPFASFKPNVNPAYCWEPVAFVGGRPLGRGVDTVRDFISEPITLQKGLTGAKPFKFCLWVLEMLGYQPGVDTLDDIFPGTGAMGKAVAFREGWAADQLRLTL